MKKKRWIIESRFYSVGRGWGDWHFTYNSADVFHNYYGIVESLNEVGGDVFPRIHKIKKDGTMSKHRFYIPWESMSTMKVLN